MINLQKNQVIDLAKSDDSNKLEDITVGMGWLIASQSKNATSTITKSRPAPGFMNKLRGWFGIEQTMETYTETVTVEKSQFEYDLDASCVELKENGTLFGSCMEYSTVYFGRKNGAGITHVGDCLVGGDGDSDDETIKINLNVVYSPRIVVFMNIYKASSRRQSFANLDKAYIRIYNTKNGKEICRYNIADDLDQTATALVLGELYKSGSEWKFKAIGQCMKADYVSEAVSYIVKSNKKWK